MKKQMFPSLQARAKSDPILTVIKLYTSQITVCFVAQQISVGRKGKQIMVEGELFFFLLDRSRIGRHARLGK